MLTCQAGEEAHSHGPRGLSPLSHWWLLQAERHHCDQEPHAIAVLASVNVQMCNNIIILTIIKTAPVKHQGRSKGKGFPYSLPSVVPRADPGLQAVIHPAVGCHYFPRCLRLPSEPQSITAPWPVSSYTAWWQRHIGVNNLPKVVKQLWPE